MRTFTLYGLRKPGEEIRYIGLTISSLKMRLTTHVNDFRGNSPHKENWIRQMLSSGIRPEIVPLAIGLSKEEVQYLEGFVIQELRAKGYPLVNISNGGESPVWSIESRQKLSKTMEGTGNHFFGKKHTTETKLKIAEAKVAQIQRDGHPLLGKKHSLDSRSKMSKSHLGKSFRPPT